MPKLSHLKTQLMQRRQALERLQRDRDALESAQNNLAHNAREREQIEAEIERAKAAIEHSERAVEAAVVRTQGPLGRMLQTK